MMLNVKILFCKSAKKYPREDCNHKCLTIDQRKWIVLVSCHIMKFRLESVKLRDEILLVLNRASLTTPMICIDKRNCPCQRNPPLILPICLLSGLKNQVKKIIFIWNKIFTFIALSSDSVINSLCRYWSPSLNLAPSGGLIEAKHIVHDKRQ